MDSPLCARAIKLAEGIGVLSLVIQWISASADECWKTNRTEPQPLRPLVPLARCDLYSDLSAGTKLSNLANHNAFNHSAFSIHFPPFPSPHVDPTSSLSLPFFTRLFLSCHHSHLNPACMGPDRADWFPVRRCLERVLELSGCVHPPLLHSNLKGRPCLLLRLCCRRTCTKYIKAYTPTRMHIRKEPTVQRFQYLALPSEGSCLIAKHCYCLPRLNEFYGLSQSSQSYWRINRHFI